jgi:predicted ATP-dependent endonuclease of OLD family
MTSARHESDTEGKGDDLVHRSIKNRLSLQKNVSLPGSDVDHFRNEEDEADILRHIEESCKNGKILDLALVAWMRSIKTTDDSFKSAITTQIKAVGTSLRDALSNLIYHGPIRPICDEITKARKSEPGMMEWWNLAADPKLLAKVNDWLASDIFRTKYRLDFERLFPDSSLKQVLQYLSEKRSIGELLEAAFEAKLNSDEQFYESVIDPVAFDMEQHLEEENEDEDERKAVARRHAHDAVIDESWERGRDHFNSLLDDSGTDEIEAFVIGGVNQKLADLRGKLEAVRQRDVTTSGGFDSAKICFRGFGSENDVSPSNMGIGFSQMMPLVASAFGAENSLIAIEQPELHVHPALQTELADLFIQSAKERGNRFLIETHSEHLILRVMKRIRQTFEDKVPEGKRRITPDDVCVLYVETGENGSIVREMPLNERGELVKGWPGGFFEEAMNEMFEP